MGEAMAFDSNGNWWDGNVLVGNVGNLYQNYLGREADQAGLDYFNNQLSSGAMDYNQVRSALVSSPEYQNIASSSTDPFVYNDHDNNPNTMPTLSNNPNSAIKFDHNYGGNTGVSVVSGDGFGSFTMDSNNASNPYSSGTPDSWGSSAGAIAPNELGATSNQIDWSSLMGGLNSLFQSQSDMYGNLMQQQSGAYGDMMNSFSDMFSDLNSKQDDAENAWVTDFNQSSVLPPQYQVGMGGAKNGSSLSWANNNPWNVRTF